MPFKSQIIPLYLLYHAVSGMEALSFHICAIITQIVTDCTPQSLFDI